MKRSPALGTIPADVGISEVLLDITDIADIQDKRDTSAAGWGVIPTSTPNLSAKP